MYIQCEEEITSEHENGGIREVKTVDQQILHTLSIINTPFKLVWAVFIRYPTNHRPFRATDATGRVNRRRRRWVVMAGKVRGLVVVAGKVTLLRRRRRRRKASRVGDDSDGAADGASDGTGAWRKLQRRPAVGTVDEDHRGG